MKLTTDVTTKSERTKIIFLRTLLRTLKGLQINSSNIFNFTLAETLAKRIKYGLCRVIKLNYEFFDSSWNNDETMIENSSQQQSSPNNQQIPPGSISQKPNINNSLGGLQGNNNQFSSDRGGRGRENSKSWNPHLLESKHLESMQILPPNMNQPPPKMV